MEEKIDGLLPALRKNSFPASIPQLKFSILVRPTDEPTIPAYEVEARCDLSVVVLRMLVFIGIPLISLV